MTETLNSYTIRPVEDGWAYAVVTQDGDEVYRSRSRQGCEQFIEEA